MGNSYLGAFLAVIAFGTYMAPLKKWPLFSSWTFLPVLSWGLFISANVVGFLTNTIQLNSIGLLCGFIWVGGGALCFWAVQKEKDLAGTGVRSMGISILTSFLVGVFLFKEAIHLYFSIPAILAILLGLSLLAPQGIHFFRNWRSLAAGAIFGSYLIPYQLLEMNYMDFIYPFSTGIFITSHLLIFVLYKKRAIQITPMKGAIFATMGAGVLWMVGTHGCFWALNGLGYAIGYPLTQLNLLVNLMWGIIIFKEYPTAKERLKIVFAAMIILIGALFLTLARA